MRRLFARLIPGLIALLLLSGCMTAQFGTSVNTDGTGTNEMIVGFSKTFLESVGDEEDPFADLKQEVSESPEGWKAESVPWEDDTYKGVKVTVQFNDVQTMDAQLKQLFGPGGDSGNGFFDSIEATQEGDTLVVRATMQAKASSSDTMPPELAAQFKVTWSVQLPTITSYTEQQIATLNGNRVTYDFPMAVSEDTTYTIEVRGTLSGSDTPQTNPTPVPAAELPGERCFAEVPYCITGRIRQYWEENGGLPVFGFPISAQQEEMIEGQPYQVQWFERNRLELHPENARPYDVLLCRLGVDVLTTQGRDWQSFEKTGEQDGCVFFPDTGQSACGEVLAAWRANGLEMDGQAGFSQTENMALFGQPVSPPMTETLSDGNTYTVQYFERARFELHPENNPPYNVLLGLLGNAMRGN